MSKTFLGISKPSQALTAMVKGLKEAETIDRFDIDMNCYFDRDVHGNCWGCAATCTLQNLTGKSVTAEDASISKLTTHNFWARSTGELSVDVCEFELAMDLARKGDLESLFIFFEIKSASPVVGFYLSTPCWEDQINMVEVTIEELKEKGL